MREITEIILHCSATWSKQDIGVKEIAQWHTMPEPKGRGWKHIGYHYVIRRNGALEKGCPIEQAGIHCSGHNARSIGICMVGGGPMGEDDNFTDEQFDTLAMLIRQLRISYPLANIYGHREFAQKACPVFSVPSFLARYGIAKFVWDSTRWAHFKPSEFSALWGSGDMPKVWSKTLDNLELLRAKYGKPLVLLKTEYKASVPSLSCDIKVPTADRVRCVDMAMRVGFGSAMAIDKGVRVYGVIEAQA